MWVSARGSFTILAVIETKIKRPSLPNFRVSPLSTLSIPTITSRARHERRRTLSIRNFARGRFHSAHANAGKEGGKEGREAGRPCAKEAEISVPISTAALLPPSLPPSAPFTEKERRKKKKEELDSRSN